MVTKIFVQGPGLEKVKLVEVAAEGDVAAVVRHARDSGLQVGDDEVVVMAEDTGEELDLHVSLEAAGLGEKASVHIGRCRKVDVGVRYNGATKQEEFSPAQRLRHVFKWATGNRGFDITTGDAQDLVLVVRGQQQTLDLDDHVGVLVSVGTCGVELDLVPTERIQG